jgi:hypothetical protein
MLAVVTPCCVGFGQLLDYQPPGTRVEVSPALDRILATPQGAAMYAAAREAAQKYYKIVAVGSQTGSEVVARIAGVFTEFYAARWTKPVTPESLANSEEFKQTVYNICLLCSRRGTPEAKHVYTSIPIEKQDTEKDYAVGAETDWTKIALVSLGVLAVGAVLFSLTKSRRSAPVTALVVPTAVAQ